MYRRRFLSASTGLSLMSLAGFAMPQRKPQSVSATKKFLIYLDGLMFLEFVPSTEPSSLVVSCPAVSNHEWRAEWKCGTDYIGIRMRGQIDLRDNFDAGKIIPPLPKELLRFSKVTTGVGELNSDKQALRLMLPLPDKIDPSQCKPPNGKQIPSLDALNQVGDSIHTNHRQRPLTNYASGVTLTYTCKDKHLRGGQLSLYANSSSPVPCSAYLDHINRALEECKNTLKIFKNSDQFDLQFKLNGDPCACISTKGPDIPICGVMGLLNEPDPAP